MSGAHSSIEIDKNVVERLISHIEHNSTDMLEENLHVPAAHFVSKDRAEAELALLRRLPLIVALGSELREPGSFITRDIMGIGLILVRRSDGGIAAFRNMCRHRGGRLENEASGKKALFTCQYHGWSYEREGGTLAGVPQSKVFGDLDRSCHGLERFRAEERQGLVFVWLSAGRDESLADFLGETLEDQLARWEFDRCKVFIDNSFDLDVNWKLVIDGALDSLHPPYLHPETVAKLVNSRSSVFQDMGRHGRLYQGRRKFKDVIAEGKGHEMSSTYVASILSLYPNVLIMGAPDHVEFWTIWPDLHNPSRCKINIRLLVRPEILTPEMEERVNRSYKILVDAQLTEDWPMELSIQRNIEANPDAVFVYGRGEVSAQHLHRELAKDLSRD